MNAFNKLYNIILQSIITQDINSKIKKAINTLIQSGQLKDQNDPKAEQVKEIIKRNANIDINGKTKLAQLLKTNQKYVNRAEVAKDNYLDNIKEFSQKKEYPKGVVVYKVEDSLEGMNAVRKIVDAQWGEDCNPWCLISRDNNKKTMYQALKYWCNYSAFPKHIAFQNGKLLAFCANNKGNCTWWDRNDKPTNELKLSRRVGIPTDKYSFTKEDLNKLEKLKKYFEQQRLNIIAAKYNLVYNQQTQSYDCDSDVDFSNHDLANGKFPIKFGHIKGNFIVPGDIKSLQNSPEIVDGNFRCYWCSYLKNLKGAPKKVGGWFSLCCCFNLLSLEGAPQGDNVGDYIYYDDCCTKLKISKEDKKKYKLKNTDNE